MSRGRPTALAPLALTSDGALVLNAAEFQDDTKPETVLRVALATGLKVFIGILVPNGHRAWLARAIDDASADVAGRIGGALIAGQEFASASVPSSAAGARGGRGPRSAQAAHPRGRRPGP